MKKHTKKDTWKDTHWDTWSLWRKALHILSVIGYLGATLIMLAGISYVVLVMFGVYGFIVDARNFILLDIIHAIFG